MWGHLGVSLVVFSPLLQGEEPMAIKSIFHEEEESAQFKELFVIIMALDSIPEPFNLFSDSL